MLDYEYNRVKSFVALMYQRNLKRTKNKPTRVEKNSAVATDHIITSCVWTCDFKTAILKTDSTDHFPIVSAMKNEGPSQQNVQKLNICTNVTMMKKISKLSITDNLRSIKMELKLWSSRWDL